jgi:hypothetical protein
MRQNLKNMRIENTNQHLAGVSVPKAIQAKTAAPSPAFSGLEQTERLKQTLASPPEVRPDQVARARALAADPNYPSDIQLQKLAGLLADHLNQ